LWLKEVDKWTLINSLRNLDKAYQNFFREQKKGNKEQGFPKFKSKHGKQSYRTSFNNNNIEIKNNKIKLPKLKWIKCKITKEIEGRILNVTISKSKTDKYFVSICCTDINKKYLPESKNYIGIDLGIKDFAIISNGEIIQNPKYLSKLERKLKREQRKLSRKQKGSKNRNKQRIRLAKIYEKIVNQKLDFLHKTSTKIINENQIICLEDLNVKNMVENKRNKKSKLSKAILSVSWGEFKRQLIYKSNWYGRQLVIINRFYPSSQLCNICGYQNKEVKDLSIREWICLGCGEIHNRDLNASKNILKEGLRLLAG